MVGHPTVPHSMCERSPLRPRAVTHYRPAPPRNLKALGPPALHMPVPITSANKEHSPPGKPCQGCHEPPKPVFPLKNPLFGPNSNHPSRRRIVHFVTFILFKPCSFHPPTSLLSPFRPSNPPSPYTMRVFFSHPCLLAYLRCCLLALLPCCLFLDFWTFGRLDVLFRRFGFSAFPRFRVWAFPSALFFRTSNFELRTSAQRLWPRHRPRKRSQINHVDTFRTGNIKHATT
jgi:hypothetical protein